MRRVASVLGCVPLALVLAARVAVAAEPVPERAPADFASPEQAVTALVDAFRQEDAARMLEVLGGAGRDLIASGDDVADRRARARFLESYRVAHRIVEDAPGHAGLRIGADGWRLPIPIVRADGAWHFDSGAGRQVILDRRIGRNELSVIEVCRAYVSAQREFAAARAQEAGRREYAAYLDSHPGARDGLYWDAKPGEAPSPLGPLVARARVEGYGGAEPPGARVPYHGYYFRILTGQGVHASGGLRDYIRDGHMTDGFALIAFPAKWGDSGIMTFIVNQDGIVFERNLGPDTARLAGDIARFDPDSAWLPP
jgi:hypothetical protein